MSKLARKPIVISEGVTVAREGSVIRVTGKLGSLSVPVLPHIDVEIKGSDISLGCEALHAQARANWGTLASLLKSAIHGVSHGFEKRLEIEGIGFKASMEGTTLVLNVGFTHQVKFVASEGIAIKTEKNVIIVSGVDKGLVGETAARIRKIKKPEPYKGKGIHYVGEVIRRKAGKKVAGVGTEATKK